MKTYNARRAATDGNAAILSAFAFPAARPTSDILGPLRSRTVTGQGLSPRRIEHADENESPGRSVVLLRGRLRDGDVGIAFRWRAYTWVVRMAPRSRR